MQATNVVHHGRPAVAKTLNKELRGTHTRQEQADILLPAEQALAAMEGMHLVPLPVGVAPQLIASRRHEAVVKQLDSACAALSQPPDRGAAAARAGRYPGTPTACPG